MSPSDRVRPFFSQASVIPSVLSRDGQCVKNVSPAFRSSRYAACVSGGTRIPTVTVVSTGADDSEALRVHTAAATVARSPPMASDPSMSELMFVMIHLHTPSLLRASRRKSDRGAFHGQMSVGAISPVRVRESGPHRASRSTRHDIKGDTSCNRLNRH